MPGRYKIANRAGTRKQIFLEWILQSNVPTCGP